MSKTIRTNIEATRTRYRGVIPREAQPNNKEEGRFSKALRQQRTGYEKHKNRESWRTEQ